MARKIQKRFGATKEPILLGSGGAMPTNTDGLRKMNRVVAFYITNVTVSNHKCCIEQYVDYWREMAHAFGMDWVYCINLSKIPNEDLPNRPTQLTYIDHMRQVSQMGYTLVSLDPKSKNNIQDFEHPEDNVAYLSWPDEVRQGASDLLETPTHYDVAIPTKLDRRLGRLTLWSIHAMGIVLYDRIAKLSPK